MSKNGKNWYNRYRIFFWRRRAGSCSQSGQTAMGKAPVGVAELAKQYRKPVIALAGCVTEEAAACHQADIDAFFPILRRAVTLEEAMAKELAGRNLAETAEQVYRLYSTAHRQNQAENS